MYVATLCNFPLYITIAIKLLHMRIHHNFPIGFKSYAIYEYYGHVYVAILCNFSLSYKRSCFVP